MSEIEIRSFLLMVREILANPIGAPERFRALRRWLRIQEQLPLMELPKGLESCGEEDLRVVQRALASGQVESKLWVLRALRGLVEPGRAYNTHIVGSWIGLLPLLLKWMAPEMIGPVTTLDIDTRANEISARLNRQWHRAGRMKIESTNALEFGYAPDTELVINLSCEHFAAQDLKAWLARLPGGRLVVLQSNNLRSDPEHINCQSSAIDFQKSLALESFLFVDEFVFEKYSRYMVIGITGH